MRRAKTSSRKSLPVTTSPPAVTAFARDMIRLLRDARDPERARGVQRFFKETIQALGIATPTLRSFVRDQQKTVRGRWTAAQAVSCCERLLQEPELEIRGAGILVLSAFGHQLGPEFAGTAERWLEERLDNWALVDSFCGAILSPLLEQHPELEGVLRRWSRSPTLWVRRASLVTLVPFAGRGLLLETTYELAREHFVDREDLMHKATGWLLREAGKTDLERLRKHLLAHGAAVPRTTLRYAIERFPVKERRALLLQTRQPV